MYTPPPPPLPPPPPPPLEGVPGQGDDIKPSVLSKKAEDDINDVHIKI